MGRSRPTTWAGRVRHGLALLLALSAAALTAAALDAHPGAAIAFLLVTVGLASYLLRILTESAPASALEEHNRFPVRPEEAPSGETAAGEALVTKASAAEALAAEALAGRAAELERGNAELSEANARLAAALTFKNDLTSMLTHDVAQPISSIASLAELLCADWTDLPDDTRFELATKIDKNTHRLIKMMNDLQLLFRLDTGSVTARRAPVPVLEVMLAITSTEDNLDVEVDEDLAVLADREHLTVVLQNLVDNALAYGEMPVLVSAARRGEWIAVSVQDNGPGIGEEQLPNLFGRFMRGAGLGLFIVRHLVEANGGSVKYEQVRPRGAKLTVTWEAAPI